MADELFQASMFFNWIQNFRCQSSQNTRSFSIQNNCYKQIYTVYSRWKRIQI